MTTEGVEGQGGRGTRTGLWGDPGQAVGRVIPIRRGPDRCGRGAGGTRALGTRVAGSIERDDRVRMGGATGKARVGEGVRADGRDQGAVAIDAVALYPDGIDRGGPGEVELLARAGLTASPVGTDGAVVSVPATRLKAAIVPSYPGVDAPRIQAAAYVPVAELICQAAASEMKLLVWAARFAQGRDGLVVGAAPARQPTEPMMRSLALVVMALPELTAVVLPPVTVKRTGVGQPPGAIGSVELAGPLTPRPSAG